MPTLSKNTGTPGDAGQIRPRVAAIRLGPGPRAGRRGLGVVSRHGESADGRNEKEGRNVKSPTKNKFGAKKTAVNGIQFDSKAEAKRYGQLVLLQKAGEVAGLTLQVPFVLAQSVKFAGAARAKPALRYVADFVYTDVAAGKIVVEDCKGVLTEGFQIKRHLMLAVHGIDVRLTK